MKTPFPGLRTSEQNDFFRHAFWIIIYKGMYAYQGIIAYKKIKVKCLREMFRARGNTGKKEQSLTAIVLTFWGFSCMMRGGTERRGGK